MAQYTPEQRLVTEARLPVLADELGIGGPLTPEDEAAINAAATRAEAAAASMEGLKEAVDSTVAQSPADSAVAAVVLQDGTQARAAVVGEIEGRRIAPALSPLTERAEPLRTVYWQEPGAVYAGYSRVGEVPLLGKSTDGGDTWQDRGRLPWTPAVLVKVAATGTLLAIEQKGTTTVGGSKPRMVRSTDDGMTWAEVPAGLNFPPLDVQGVSEGTDGSILVGEYGNVGETVHRILRSTDDGLTWTTVLSSSGQDPQGDPGHFHCVVFDPVARKHVAFMDRPIRGGGVGPHLYESENNGATWRLIGVADTVDKPNFVRPMFFPNYVAWASDNQINGRFSRLPRDDFYAGRWDAVEHVAQLSQKAAYGVFPLRPDVWAVALNGEHIPSSLQSGGGGSTMSEVFLVSGDGAIVSGGMESYYASRPAGPLTGVRPKLPGHRYDTTDHGGLLWANMPVGRPRAFAAVPATQGWEPPTKRMDLTAIPRLPAGTAFDVVSPDGSIQRIIEAPSSAYTAVAGTHLPTRAELRLGANGTLSVSASGTLLATVRPDSERVHLVGGVNFSTSGHGIRLGSGSPEGVVAAPQGSIYLNYGGNGAAVWTKETGGGEATGWMPSRTQASISANRPASPYQGLMFFDNTLRKPIWWRGDAWVDATGATV